MLLAVALRKPLFVRHCGNWLKPVTTAEHFWKWFMEKFAGTRNVMLATGGAPGPPSASNSNIRWIFSTSLSTQELKTCSLRRESLPRGQVRLIIACRQDSEKGSGIVIESLSNIQRDFPQVTLDILGDGPALGDLKRLAVKSQVSNKVTFHGKVNHRRVIELLQNADLFCYPTRASEGCPKVVLEALACGLPVITTKVSVLPQLIASGCGSLLEEATPAALAREVCKILSNEELYCEMSSQAVKTAGHYSLEQWRDGIGYELRAAWAEHRGKEWKALRSNA
jgi:glycosyltransferase involved in cell wall biosynthesis